jgi:RNA polymerase sigma factor (sigma-70 family)
MQLEIIIKGCKDQTPAMQRRLFEQFAPYMMTACRRYVSDESSAEDILQEAFLKIFKNIHQYDASKGSIEPWMRRIVVNQAIEFWRKHYAKYAFVSEENMPDLPDNNLADSSLSEEEILKLIRDLPPGFRMVFNLAAIEGYSHLEIATQLNITESTSRSQLTRARKMLQVAYFEQNKVFSNEKY